MNGAQLFETTVLVPKWTAAPPTTFSYLTDKNGVSLKIFWIIFHSLHEITFVLAIAFCWKIAPVRNGLLLLFAAHFLVRVWTLSYFAPNIINFQNMYESKKIASDLVNKTSLWKTLNYVRVAMFIAISLGLIPVCKQLLNLRYK
jgi:hypothetical protein